MGLQGIFTGDVRIRNLDGLLVAASGVVYSYDSIQATAFLNVFTSSLKGLVPASGGSATNFLCANGTWVAPPGSGTTTNSVTFNNSGSGAASGTTFNGSAARTISYNTIGAQQASAILTALAGLTYASGTPFVKMTGANTFALDTNTYLTANQTITLSGDGSGSGTTAITLTLATVNSNIGTFNNVTVNAKGLVTAASNASYFTGSGTTGQVTFFTSTSAVGGDSAFFWDNTNKRLGLGTAFPGRTLDVHGTGVIAQFNGTGTNNAYLDFQNAGSTQWRIGNQYAAAANNFTIFNAAGSTEVFSISQAGNVAIGNTVPSSGYRLSLNGNSTTNTGGIVIRQSGTDVMYIGNVSATNTTDFEFFNPRNGYIRYATNGIERMRITSGGQLNIGGSFTSTNNTLQVTGNAAIGYTTAAPANGLIVNGNVGIGTATNSGSKLQVLGGALTVGGVNTYALTLGNSSGNDLSFGTDASYSYIQSWASKPLQINNQGNNIILNATSGNVGIGTTSPDFRLDVRSTATGTAASFGISGLTINPRLRIDADEANNTVTLNPNYNGATSPALVFKTQEIERMRITSSGRILAGVTLPTDNGVDALQVNGSVRASSYKTQSGTISLPSTVNTQFYSFTQRGVYIVKLYLAGGNTSSIWTATAIVSFDATDVVTIANVGSTNVTIIVSGTTLQGRNIGSTFTFNYDILRMNTD